MAFSFYRAPEAPAPDYGAVVHARLGQRANQQAAINALLQLAEENQKLKAAKEQHAAVLAQEGQRLSEETRYHHAEETARQATLDENTKSREDTNTRLEASQEENARMRMMAEAARMVRSYQDEQGRMERAHMEQQHYLQAEEAHRQFALQGLQHAATIVKGHLGAMQDIAAAKRNPDLFETHTFSALEASPYYSPDPSVMKKKLSNTGLLQGKSADEVYDALAKTKVDIPIVKDPNWFTAILQKHDGQTDPNGTPTENLDEASIEHLTRYSHQQEYADSLPKAEEMAGKFFKQSSEVGPLFSGGKTEAQLPMPKAAVDQGPKNARSLAMMRYKANLQFASMPLSGDAKTDALITHAKQENDAIEKQLVGDDAPAPAPAPGGGDLQKELDDLLKDETPK